MSTKLRTLGATALLLSMAYAPQAFATVNGNSWSFSTVLNSGVGSNGSGTPGPYTDTARTFAATFTTDAPTGATTGIYNINSIVQARLGAPLGTTTTANIVSVSPTAGPYGQINFGTGRIVLNASATTPFGFDFTPSNTAIYGAFSPFTLSTPTYNTAGVLRVIGTDVNGDGGTSIGTLTRVPEIDGGMLPRAIGVLAGVFLMLFGRKKQEEIA